MNSMTLIDYKPIPPCSRFCHFWAAVVTEESRPGEIRGRPSPNPIERSLEIDTCDFWPAARVLSLDSSSHDRTLLTWLVSAHDPLHGCEIGAQETIYVRTGSGTRTRDVQTAFGYCVLTLFAVIGKGAREGESQVQQRLISSIRFRLTLLVLVAILPALALQFLASAEDRQREIASNEATVDRLVDLARLEEGQSIDGTHDLLAALAAVPEVRSLDPAICGAYLEQLLDARDSYANFGAIDLEGELRCSAIPFAGEVTAADRSYFQRALSSGDFAIGDYQVGRITGEPGINFGHPISDPATGESIGVVFAAVGLERLNRTESTVLADLPAGSTLAKIDSDGRVVVRLPSTGEPLGEPFAIHSVLTEVFARDHGTKEAIDPSGIRRLYLFAPVDSRLFRGGLHVIVGIPTEAVYGQIDRQMRRNLIGIGLTSGLALLAVWFGSRRFFLKPLDVLVQATRRLMGGDMSVRTGMTGESGELGVLGNAFDQMVSALEDQDQERDRFQRQLEFQARLLENVNDAILATDAEFRLIAWNRAAEEMYGWKAEEALGRSVGDVIHSEFSPEDREQGLRAMARGESLRLEVTQYRRDGTPIVVEGTTMALRGDDGELQGYVSVNRDMTERKRAEQERRESEIRFRTLFEESPVSLWEEDFSALKARVDQLRRAGVTEFRDYFDRNAGELLEFVRLVRILDVNKATLELFGAESKADLLGDLGRVAGEGALQDHKESILSIVRGDTEFAREAVNYTLGGDKLHVLVRWVVSPGYEDTYGRVLVSLVDITERVEAEKTLEMYSERLKMLHEIDQGILSAQSPREIGAAALQRIKDLLSCLRASVALFGLGASEATLLAVFAEDESSLREGSQVPVEAFGPVERLRQGEVHIVEDLEKAPSLRDILPELMHAGVRSYFNVPMISRGQLVGCLNLGFAAPAGFGQQEIWIARDVANSLAVALEDARLLRSSQKQGRRLRAMTARLSELEENERRQLARELHDRVGQSLTALSISLNMMRNQLGDQVEAGIAQRLRESIELVEHISEQTHDVMAELRPPVLDDYGLVPALHWYADELSGRTGRQVIVRGNERIPRLALQVEVALFRIAQEAITNAVKHSGAGHITIMVEEADGAIELQIADDGRGFDPSELPMSEQKGHWGLAIMRERAAMIDGRLRVRSAPGEGTRVTVTVPWGEKQ
jgi:PAS domain S-box-containing protein